MRWNRVKAKTVMQPYDPESFIINNGHPAELFRL